MLKFTLPNGAVVEGPADEILIFARGFNTSQPALPEKMPTLPTFEEALTTLKKKTKEGKNGKKRQCQFCGKGFDSVAGVYYHQHLAKPATLCKNLPKDFDAPKKKVEPAEDPEWKSNPHLADPRLAKKWETEPPPIGKDVSNNGAITVEPPLPVAKDVDPIEVDKIRRIVQISREKAILMYLITTPYRNVLHLRMSRNKEGTLCDLFDKGRFVDSGVSADEGCGRCIKNIEKMAKEAQEYFARQTH